MQKLMYKKHVEGKEGKMGGREQFNNTRKSFGQNQKQN